MGELVTLLAALINASPKLIQIVEDLHAKGAKNETLLTPEQHATVVAVLGTVHAAAQVSTQDPVVAAMGAV